MTCHRSTPLSAWGLSKSYVSEIEKGDKNVSMATLQKYSDAFDIPMSSLLFVRREGGRGGEGRKCKGVRRRQSSEDAGLGGYNFGLQRV